MAGYLLVSDSDVALSHWLADTAYKVELEASDLGVLELQWPIPGPSARCHH